MGPLLSMLQGTEERDKVHHCLDTLGFLLLDKSNRKTVLDLGGIGTILAAMQRFPDPCIQSLALDCALNLVKHDEADKARVWRLPLITTLITAKRPLPQQLELLCFAKKVAFSFRDGPQANGQQQQVRKARSGSFQPRRLT